MNKVLMNAKGASLHETLSAFIRAALGDVDGLNRKAYRPSARCCYRRDPATGLVSLSMAGAVMANRLRELPDADEILAYEVKDGGEFEMRLVALAPLADGSVMEAVGIMTIPDAAKSVADSDPGYPLVAIADKWEREEWLARSGYEGWREWREFEREMRRLADDLEGAGR